MMELAASSADRGLRQKKTRTILVPQGGFALRFACRRGQNGNSGENTIRARFSLDETFDVGEDTGTPVVEDYADKMPFKFPGTLKKFVIDLTPNPLTPAQTKEVDEDDAAAGYGGRISRAWHSAGHSLRNLSV